MYCTKIQGVRTNSLYWSVKKGIVRWYSAAGGEPEGGLSVIFEFLSKYFTAVVVPIVHCTATSYVLICFSIFSTYT